MNYQFSNTYKIVQNGKTLSSPDKIKLNCYSNKTERFTFEFDDSIPSYLYISALFTHQTKGYQVFEPILYDYKLNEYYYIIGNSITNYPGLWSLTIVGTEQDYVITDFSNVDETMFLYLSNPFKKIVVLKSEINGDLANLSYPNIDKMSYDFKAIHANVAEIAVEIAELKGQCELILEENKQVLADTEALREEYQDMLTQCQDILTSCREEQRNLTNLYSNLSNQLRSEFNNYLQQLREG